MNSGNFDGMGTPIIMERMIAAICRAAWQGASAGATYCLTRLREHSAASGRIACCTFEDLAIVLDYADSTAYQYGRCARKLMAFRDDRGRPPDRRDMVMYLQQGRLDGKGEAWYNLNLAANRAVFDRGLGFSITVGIPYAGRPAPLKPTTPATVTRLIDAAAVLQERIALHLLRIENIRPGQIADLCWDQIHDGIIDVYRCDGRKRIRRQVTLSPETKALLADLTRARTLLNMAHPKPTDSVLGMSLRTFQRRFERLCRRAGVTITPARIRKNPGTLIPPDDPLAEAG